jgi:CHAD domain-containing protein
MHGAIVPGALDAPAPLLLIVGPATGPSRPSSSIGYLVSRQVEALVSELSRREPDVRRDEPDGVRKMRVATRRLRAGLSTFQPIFSAERIEPLIGELRWLGSELARPRDAAALRDHLDVAVGGLPPELCTGTVMELLASELRSRYREAHTGLLDAFGSRRYADLVDALDALVGDPPLDARAGRPAELEVERLVRRTVRRVHKRSISVESCAEGIEREHALHDVRNAAKRSRYAAELAAPALGKRFTRLARRMKRLQDVLGEWHDGVSFSKLLREVGGVASRADGGAFIFGVLYGSEQERAQRALQRYEPSLRAALEPL